MSTFDTPVKNYGLGYQSYNPYDKAKAEWDDRIGSARIQAYNWRLAAFGMIGLCLVLALGLIYQSSKSQIIPYIVEVDTEGRVNAVRPAIQQYRPTEAQIAYHLSTFVKSVRAKASDPIVVRQSWVDAYAYLSQKGAEVLNAYAQESDPFKDVGKIMRTVEISNVIRRSPKTFQIRWRETVYEKGIRQRVEQYTGLFEISFGQPTNDKELLKNPLGILIDNFSWSLEY